MAIHSPVVTDFFELCAGHYWREFRMRRMAALQVRRKITGRQSRLKPCPVDQTRSASKHQKRPVSPSQHRHRSAPASSQHAARQRSSCHAAAPGTSRNAQHGLRGPSGNYPAAQTRHRVRHHEETNEVSPPGKDKPFLEETIWLPSETFDATHPPHLAGRSPWRPGMAGGGMYLIGAAAS